MAYPHSRSETIADGVVHLTGLALAIPASVILLHYAARGDLGAGATALYAGSMLLAFAASALYHMTPLDHLRPLLNRIDHAAIYFKIAGTYTPFVVLIGSGFAYGVLGVVWLLALFGAVAKLSFWGTQARGSLALYLAMGWLSALLIWPMWQVLPHSSVWLIVIGGLIYSAGTRVYAHPGMRYQNAIWHVFVLVASTCLFLAVALSV